ncbi:NAD(P)H-dependent oxidoreductase [Arthrobacter sp. ISL-5]|uniref:NAD(P)H-dependent oxidoreductase n=1 Tax=Arthrobacter sp. ISL-5 TaxID=2819111 RepID=UPI001BE901A9|nr:NAD(P)H-dependent oxidoreductase [Arthrobacter sp. ISL-5]MBT2551758.1 NAD(P)H-dependent oxidoreductase [Arthrobacter sp. ISL-5]
MSKVLILVGHPDLAQSKHNTALLDAVRDLAHVTVHDLYAAYPDFQIDAEAERALLAEHDVIVFQHPVYWYSTPALFRQWQDDVLTYGWAFTFDGSPSQLAGKKAVVAVTAGGSVESYTPEGMNKTTIETLLGSWDATLRMCQLDIEPMFKVYGTVVGLSDEELTTAAKEYNELIASFAS